jgi:ATP-binding cassette subfamily F protein uup
MPARLLSGGEKNRLLLARLFLQPANILVLDEPTNDLDLETLELLEELLVEYDGAILLVSHDREFLDRVVNASLVFEQPGVIREIIGGYADWLAQRPAAPPPPPEPPGKGGGKPKRKTERPPRFLNREQRELDEMPARLETLESRHAALAAKLADPRTYIETPDEIPKLETASRELENEMEAAFARWDELEKKKAELAG